MLKNVNPTKTQAWKDLLAHFNETKGRTLKDLFASDSKRFDEFSLSVGNGDIVADYSKNLIDEKTMSLLVNLANELSLIHI